jgi:hypothetical protein
MSPTALTAEVVLIGRSICNGDHCLLSSFFLLLNVV